jgi:hypothetical protein
MKNVIKSNQMIQNFHICFIQMKQGQKHNELTFLQETIGDVYILHKQDKHHVTCLKKFN